MHGGEVFRVSQWYSRVLFVGKESLEDNTMTRWM